MQESKLAKRTIFRSVLILQSYFSNMARTIQQAEQNVFDMIDYAQLTEWINNA